MSTTLANPAKNAVEVDYSSADVDLKGVHGLLLGTAGTLAVDMHGGATNVSLPLQAGYNPIRVTKVYNSGSTAGLNVWALS